MLFESLLSYQPRRSAQFEVAESWRLRADSCNFVGDLTAGVPPVPIPNTEVKPRRADGTARESVWERRSLPALNKSHAEKSAWPFLFGTTGAKRCVSRIPLSHQTVSRNS